MEIVALRRRSSAAHWSCTSDVSEIRVRAVKYGVHLIIRLCAVRTQQRRSSDSRISYAFGAVAAVPAFVKAVTQDCGTKRG